MSIERRCFTTGIPWLLRNDSASKYLMNRTTVRYTDGLDSCEALNATFAAVTSWQEQSFLISKMPT